MVLVGGKAQDTDATVLSQAQQVEYRMSRSMAVDAQNDWVPAQYPKSTETVDLRSLTAVQPRGYKEIKNGKRKRVAEDKVEVDHPMDMHVGLDEHKCMGQSLKRQKADETSYRPVLVNLGKALEQRASTIMRPSSFGRKSWAKKMAEKATRKNLLEQKAGAVAVAKAKRKSAADQRKAAKERKTANQQKSAVVQKITSSATVKKMMKDKKQRKLLRTADTN